MAGVTQILVDTQGRLLRVAVHAANIADRDGAQKVLRGQSQYFPRPRHLWVDAGYRGRGKEWVETTLDWTVTVVQRPPRWV